MDQESIVYELDNRSMLKAIAEISKAQTAGEKVTVDSQERVQRALERVSEFLVKSADRSANALKRQTDAIIKQNEAYGKSPIEKVIQARDLHIRKLQGEQAVIDRVTASYDKLIKKMKEEEGGGGHGGGFNARYAIFAAKDIGEGRLKYAAAEAVNLLTAMKGAPVIIGGVVAGLAAIAGASVEAVRSLAEYGNEVRDFSLRTGIATKNFEAFRFAARAAGNDVSVFERMTRGLTEALEDNSTSGDKARQALAKLGVSTLDFNGQTKPAEEILTQISERLGGLHNNFERNKVALDLFKRAGVDAIPVILELAENIKYANEKGILTPSDASLEHWDDYNKKIAAAAATWERLKRSALEVLAVLAEGAAGAAVKGGSLMERLAGIGGLAYGGGDSDPSPFVGPFLQYGPSLAQGTEAGTLNNPILTRFLASNNKEGLERQVAEAKRKFDEARTQVERATSSSVGDSAAKQFVSDAEKARQEYERLANALERINKLKRESESLPGFLLGIQNRTATESVDPFTRLRLQREGSLAELQEKYPDLSSSKRAAAAGAIQGYYLTAEDQLAIKQLAEAAKKMAEAAEFMERMNNEIEAQSVASTLKSATGGYLGSPELSIATLTKNSGSGPSGFGPISAKDQAEISKDILSRQIRIIELTTGPGGELEAAAKILSIKKETIAIDVQSAIDETAAIKDRFQREKKIQEIQIQGARQVYEARSEYEEKIFEQRKRIAGQIEPLVNTLFTNPGNFGSQLGSTLKAAALKPITAGISNTLAGVFQPIVNVIGGGLNGVFGGGGDPVKVSTDMNTQATYQNTQALYAAANSFRSGGAGSGTVGFGGGGASLEAGGSGFQLPVSSGGLDFTGGLGGLAALAPLLGAPGGTSGFAGPLSSLGGFGGGSSGLGGFSGLGGLRLPGFGGGGSGMPGGLTGMLGGLRGLFSGNTLSGLAGNLGAYKTILGGKGIGSFGSQLGGLASGPFAGTAAAGLAGGLGIGLALHGLTGDSAGSLSGTLQGVAGGFLAAGPIGALIGGGIGLGEQLAGVEPKWKEAQRLVKQQYGMTISKQIGQAIADIAKQKYANTVSIAVRSPEVRQLLEVYAAGTGQNIPLSSMQPHAGILVNEGGQLMQQATYQYGRPFSYSSTLPVAGIGAGSLSVAGGPQFLQLHIGGDSAASFLDGRVASTVDSGFVQSRYSQALAGSNGRLPNSASLRDPGLITA